MGKPSKGKGSGSAAGSAKGNNAADSDSDDGPSRRNASKGKGGKSKGKPSGDDDDNQSRGSRGKGGGKGNDDDRGKGKGGGKSNDDDRGKGKGGGKDDKDRGGKSNDDGKGKGKMKPSFSNEDDDPMKGKGKGKKGKKGKGKGKGKMTDGMMIRGKKRRKKKVDEALEDMDFDVPRMVEREVLQGEMDPKKLEEMRNAAIQRNKEVKAMNDPATYKRQYKCHLSVTGILNSTDRPWEVFMAVSMIKAGTSNKKDKQLKANYSYSRSYIVPPNEKKKFRVAEKVYTKMFQGSYKDLQLQELRLDLWIVVKNNFNQHLGTAVKNLYDCGSDSVYQTVMVKGVKAGTHTAFDLGIIYLSALVSEVFSYTIIMQNWQFLPPPQKKEGGKKCLVFKVPTGTGAHDTFPTVPSPGPRYGWVECGQYRFDGTAVALSCASFDVQLMNDDVLQGKAVISLGGAGDYPIAMGNVKCLTDDKAQFQQGRVGGGISLTKKSKLLPDGAIDSDPSIPAPMQPGASVVMYHLDPHTQYLLIDLSSAEGLPVADFDSGTSNPFVRVRYDGVVQQSPVVEGSLRPVWNHLFYMPVRYIEDAIRTNQRYFETLLPEELKSKGFIEVEVWHMDGVPTEFLGALKLDPRMTRFGADCERSVCEKMAKLQKQEDGEANEEEEEGDGTGTSPAKKAGQEEETQGIHRLLMKKQKTKVYGCSRQKLTGTRLQCQTQPKITFECCFIPDFPADVTFPEQPSEKGLGVRFQEAFKRWEETWPAFNDDYLAWYPDAPHNRSWPCYYQDIRGENMPIPYLAQALALPASLSSPGQVLHWCRCLEFLVPAKQKSKGKIDKWQSPDETLALRKGAVQDHAVLLCCALMGLRKDAWVVKGTVRGNVEHAWCMTREKTGCVVFWECTTGAKYHLPGRWSDDPSHGPNMKAKVSERAKGRKIRPDWKEQAQQRRDGGRRVQYMDIDDLDNLPFSPYLRLVKGDRIVHMPYESIEVVFNSTQMYGNRGNHSPACIFYDFEHDPKNWVEFMNKKEQGLINVGKGVAIPVGPAISDFTAKLLEESIDTEVKESIRMTRIRKGFESVFDENEALMEILTQYLNVLEEEIMLDIDWRCNAQGKAEKPPGHPSPFNSQPYVDSCKKAWASYWAHKHELDAKRKYLPVKENHVLSGVPFHFSGVDIKEIRYHIMDCRPILEYLALPSDDVVYFCSSKVFPMANSVASVWCWIGVQMPLSPDEVFELASEQEKNKNTSKSKSKADPKKE